jgi:hypothetical protein
LHQIARRCGPSAARLASSGSSQACTHVTHGVPAQRSATQLPRLRRTDEKLRRCEHVSLPSPADGYSACAPLAGKALGGRREGRTPLCFGPFTIGRPIGKGGRRAPPPGPLSSPLIGGPFALVPLYISSFDLYCSQMLGPCDTLRFVLWTLYCSQMLDPNFPRKPNFTRMSKAAE